MRVVPPCQLALGLEDIPIQESHWPELPEDTRGQVQGLLARLIARGVLVESQDNDTSTDTRAEVVNGEG
ncbi:MAG: hypothetical protein ACRDS0_12045 [Pseudonocardiaceae bacterium]